MMQCNKCGYLIDTESVFCQNCGEMVKELSISLSKVEKTMTDLLSDMNSEGQKKILLKLQESPFSKEGVGKSSLEVILDSSGIVFEDGESFNFNGKDLLVFAVAIAFNEFETFQNNFASLEEEFHNDRVAKIRAALIDYQRAMLEDDISIRKGELSNASMACIEGLEQIKCEMNKQLSYFEKIPRNGIKTIGVWFKIQKIYDEIDLFNNALFMYTNAVKLLIEMDAYFGSKEKILATVLREMQYLDTMLNSAAYRRFCELDDDHNETRENVMAELAETMHVFAKMIEGETIRIKITEEER